MPDPTSDHLHDVSRRAFGQAHRLGLMLAIAKAHGPVCLKDLAAELGVSASSLQTPLRHLINLGLVTQVDGDGTRRRLYVMVAGPGWDWAQELADGT